ncbi:MAG: porin PorA family protein [Acidimicrobiia bacterium]
MARTRRRPTAAFLVAGGFAAITLMWMVVGVPALVKYPTDLVVSPAYDGTFRAFVDLSTAPLDEPMEWPLTIDRRVEAIGGESGASRVLVRETIEQTAGPLLDTTQRNDYVMDRSSLENVADERAFAFDESNVVDRSGAFRLNLPFDTDRGETYRVYKNEIGDTYTMAADPEDPTTETEGLELSNFVASLDGAPLTDAYLAELNEVVTLPELLTLDQLKPHLLAAGIDVDAVLAALSPVLAPDDAATLTAFAAEPIPLEYVLSFDGRAAVEPVTGAEVKVAATESIGARPDLSGLPALQEVLGNYPDVPEAVAAGSALEDLAADPTITLLEYDYEQTPASVADVADEVRALRGQVLLVKVWIPLALGAVAVLALIVGVILTLRRRGRRGLEVIEPPDVPLEHRSNGHVRVPATAGRSSR